jgi:tetratricopeptide (TPR) repeat protein
MNTNNNFTTILFLLTCCVPIGSAIAQSTSSASTAQSDVTAPKVHVPMSIYGRPFFTGGSLLIPITPEQEAAAQDEASTYHDAISRAQSLLKSGDATKAQIVFRQALTLQPNDEPAQLGLAEVYTTEGQIYKAITTYRNLVYNVAGSTGGGSVETDPSVLMRFALLLQQTGQMQEAVSVYNRGINFLDFDDNELRKSTPVSLPQFGEGVDQEPYSPQELESMANLALFVDTFGHEGYGDPEPLTHLQKALAIAPDSAAANYYMGKYLYGKNDTGAKAYLQKAIQLGDDQIVAAAKQILQFVQ